MTVALVGRKIDRELSDSLVNRFKRVNRRVASGASSSFEFAAWTNFTTQGMAFRTESACRASCCVAWLEAVV